MLHEAQASLPPLARSVLHGIAAQLRALRSEIKRIETQILDWHQPTRRAVGLRRSRASARQFYRCTEVGAPWQV